MKTTLQACVLGLSLLFVARAANGQQPVEAEPCDATQCSECVSIKLVVNGDKLEARVTNDCDYAIMAGVCVKLKEGGQNPIAGWADSDKDVTLHLGLADKAKDEGHLKACWCTSKPRDVCDDS